jgi:hypothetical protein
MPLVPLSPPWNARKDLFNTISPHYPKFNTKSDKLNLTQIVKNEADFVQ